MRSVLERLIRLTDPATRALPVAASMLVAAAGALPSAAGAATPVGTTISFTGQATASETYDGVTVFQANITWRETAYSGARDDIAEFSSFQKLAGSGTASLTSAPTQPGGDTTPICVNGPVVPAPKFDQSSPLQVTAARPAMSVLVKQFGIGRARGYDTFGVRTFTPIGQSDTISGGGLAPVPDHAFEFCHTLSVIPPWPVYARFRTHKGVYRYTASFANQTGDCAIPNGLGTLLRFSSAWSGHLTVQFGRRTAGRLTLPMGSTTVVEPSGRTVPELPPNNLLGLYRPAGGTVNQFACI